MKVHSDGGYGENCEFVYIDEDDNLLTACVIDFIPDSCGLSRNVPLYLINRSENEMLTTETDPDSSFECLGEL